MNVGSQSVARTLATADEAHTHSSFADGLVRTVEARAEAAVAKARSVVRDAAVNARSIAGDAATSSRHALDGAARLVEGRIRRKNSGRMPDRKSVV